MQWGCKLIFPVFFSFELSRANLSILGYYYLSYLAQNDIDKNLGRDSEINVNGHHCIPCMKLHLGYFNNIKAPSLKPTEDTPRITVQ